MRTNIEIDDRLMADAMKASRLETKTKKAVVKEALQMLVKSRAQERIRELRGKVQFWDNYDYKAMRSDGPADIPSSTAKAKLRRLQAKRSLRRSAA
jgi:Arc/MetJ family transcription regulator